MAGMPLFEATLNLTFPDQSTRQLDMRWPPRGPLLIFAAEDKLADFLKHLGSFGGDVDVDMKVVLTDDPTVTAKVDWDDRLGFVPVGTALEAWVRKTQPDNCAYLDEQPLSAYILWEFEAGKEFRQVAHWLTNGEVRPRFNSDGPPDQVREEEALFGRLMQEPESIHHKGIIYLDSSPAVCGKVEYDSEKRQLWAVPPEVWPGL